MHKLNHRNFVTSALLALCLLVVGLLGTAAANAASATISHSYHTTSSIPTGSIVSLDAGQSNSVQTANTTNGSRIVGVALSSNESLIAVDQNAQELSVATSGTVATLVSTLNGTISVGNQIAVSALSGVGMKATAGSHVIGLAAAAFSSSSAGTTTQTMTDITGKSHTVTVGYIPVTIAITTMSGGGPQLNSLQKLVQSLTGHVISTPRIILAIVVAGIALALLVTLVYGSIYGSIISIGRNPLAKYVILRNLTSVLVMASLTTLVAGSIIFFLLH
jgi:hypothetical protein